MDVVRQLIYSDLNYDPKYGAGHLYAIEEISAIRVPDDFQKPSDDRGLV
jgi:hypothetical protein